MNNPFRFIGDKALNERLYFQMNVCRVLQIWFIYTYMLGVSRNLNEGRHLMANLNFALAAILVGVFFFIFAGGRYKHAAVLTLCINILGMTLQVIDTGSRYSFVAIILAFLILDNKRALIFALINLSVICGLAITETIYPNIILVDVRTPRFEIAAFLQDGIILIICMYFFFRLYERQHRHLEEAREEALHLSETKNIFLSNMSHEIRTPINVILGMTEMVLRDSRDETVSDYARKIQNAGKMLFVLVSNILDVSKIEAGRLDLIEGGYRTSALIQELFEIGTVHAHKCDLSFIIHVDDKLPSGLLGDMSRIKQIVSNFLSNATKYTTTGSITLTFGCKRSPYKNHTVLLISVKDTGIGIKKENLPILFDVFSRLDLPVNRNIDGTGLGLAIAKELTERMDGQIFVESEYGSGSVFWVEIPQGVIDNRSIGNWKLPADDNSDVPEESFTASDARVLVVDDNLENLQTVKALLRRTLMRVDLVESGTQCLEAVRKTDYHIILMDYLMPAMDGIETLRRLREEFPDFNIPVIALTANAISGTESEFLAEGFTAYITKPVRVQKLEEVLVAALALTNVTVTRRTIHPQTWVTPELKETLAQDLSPNGVSLEEGIQNASGDLSLLARMADAFIRNYPESHNQMRKISGSVPLDFERLNYLVHALKSAAGFVGAADLSSLAKMIESECANCDSQAIGLDLPPLFLKWERAISALSVFSERVHAVEPKAEQETDIQCFQPDMLADYIERRARLKAVRELELLIAEKSADCPADLLEAKRAIQELDFVKAKQILTEIGICEG